MESTKLIKFTITMAVAVAASLTGCSSSTVNGNAGSGGVTTATGGSSASGGDVGSGGNVGSGGVNATGGLAGAASGGAAGGGGHPSASNGGTSGGTGHAAGGATAGAGGGAAAGSSGGTFALTSMHLADGAHFDSKYTCASNNGQLGGGVNPDLEWVNAPAGTMSFAITFLDTTLITAGMDMYGNHWAVWNIPPTELAFAEGTKTLTGPLANAKQSGTFLAPCAQSLMNSMDDQYEFTIYALSVPTITVAGSSTTAVANARTALKTAISGGQVLGTAVLRGHAGLQGM